ncbi:MAG TPA: DUF2203 domain-containing protein [Gemmataceae bacterium]|nr:DUF2203 domain-containing protein [Gemmataceae bacterium]
MARKRKDTRYFTPAEANNMLPLVRAIVKDIVDLAHALRDQNARLERLSLDGVARGILTPEQLDEEQAAFEKDQEQLQAYVEELRGLGVEMKDLLVGLVDFPGWMDDREVCLCWKLGEAEVAWWHETNAGFRGRQPLPVHAES